MIGTVKTPEPGRNPDTPFETMQVHDELVLEVRNDALDTVRKGVVERMSAAAELDVELLVEAGAGKDWDSAH